MQYGDGTEILSTFRICKIEKATSTNKVYRLVKVKFGLFWRMSQFPGNDKVEVIVHNIEVALVHDHQFAPNTISLTSNLF